MVKILYLLAIFITAQSQATERQLTAGEMQPARKSIINSSYMSESCPFSLYWPERCDTDCTKHVKTEQIYATISYGGEITDDIKNFEVALKKQFSNYPHIKVYVSKLNAKVHHPVLSYSVWISITNFQKETQTLLDMMIQKNQKIEELYDISYRYNFVTNSLETCQNLQKHLTDAKAEDYEIYVSNKTENITVDDDRKLIYKHTCTASNGWELISYLEQLGK